jgi:peptide chain release factor 2
MSDPHDASGCYLSIHAGAGGTDACDWAAMLLRMYGRWIEAQGFKAEVLDEQPGEEAGLRSVTARVKGEYAYGYLRNEVGVHRLVRHSPFDQAHRRHTAFASVDVAPEVETREIEIDEKDLRVDTYRAGGAGGQHVNKTDSAVRITHIPTGIVVQCQNERSQHKNRRMALSLLQARLYREQEKEREAEVARQYGEKGEIAWGNQIRSYVLQPYTMCKDHRTGVETGSVQQVLDGSLDDLIEAEMRRRLKQTEERKTARRASEESR